MKHSLVILSFILLTALLVSCSGEDKHNVDKTPPYPPTMVPYLGSIGDPPTNFYGQTTPITDENSGIDAVSEGDWIRIAWKPLIDDDINLVRIFRFNDFEPEPVKIDSIAPRQTFYLDSAQSLPERVWYSYFIEVLDFAGNSALSDTVSFGLLPKPNLTFPPNGAPFNALTDSLKWENNGFASQYRVYLFNPDHEYLWHHDLFTALEDILYARVPINQVAPYSGQALYWRVDSYDWDEERQQNLKAKSNERIFYVP